MSSQGHIACENAAIEFLKRRQTGITITHEINSAYSLQVQANRLQLKGVLKGLRYFIALEFSFSLAFLWRS